LNELVRSSMNGVKGFKLIAEGVVVAEGNGTIHQKKVEPMKLMTCAEERNYLDQMRDLVLRVTSDIECTIFLFGSRARGLHRRNSDIDIGFSGLSEPVFTRVRDHLLFELEESVIPHHVDLVNIDTTSSYFRDVAMEKVIIWKQS
jgi:predicted nucleotidyltransferase